MRELALARRHFLGASLGELSAAQLEALSEWHSARMRDVSAAATALAVRTALEQARASEELRVAARAAAAEKGRV